MLKLKYVLMIIIPPQIQGLSYHRLTFNLLGLKSESVLRKVLELGLDGPKMGFQGQLLKICLLGSSLQNKCGNSAHGIFFISEGYHFFILFTFAPKRKFLD